MLEGWNLHVLYSQGKSVMEVYKRSEKITEFELIHLLNLQSGNSFWEKDGKRISCWRTFDFLGLIYKEMIKC